MLDTEFLRLYAKEIISLCVPVVAWLFNSRLRPRARLVQGVRHASTLLLNEPTFDSAGVKIADVKIVNIAQVSFVNTGSEPATDLQITFNWRPQHFNVWPQRHFSENEAPDGRFTLSLGSMPPKDLVAIDLLSVAGDLPVITSAKCNECNAKIVQLAPQEIHPRWKLGIVAWLMSIGAAASVYLTMTLLQIAIRAG